MALVCVVGITQGFNYQFEKKTWLTEACIFEDGQEGVFSWWKIGYSNNGSYNVTISDCFFWFNALTCPAPLAQLILSTHRKNIRCPPRFTAVKLITCHAGITFCCLDYRCKILEEYSVECITIIDCLAIANSNDLSILLKQGRSSHVTLKRLPLAESVFNSRRISLFWTENLELFI